MNTLPKGFELLPFEFMRGRSIPDTMIVVDEFQNTNLHEAKTILTRVGENTKMVIMGDPSQIDVSPNFLNATNNGLTVSATLLTNRELPMDKRSRVARVHLRQGVRSGFADMASEVFNQPMPLD
jgi:PhoH-like ATPase